MCYTIIVIDFCASSDWDSWDDPGSPQICCIAHVVKFVRMVVGLLCPLPFLSHVNIGMNSDFPVGLMFPSNGRSKCTERLDAPIGCVQAFLRCRRLQRRNREKYVKKGYLLFLD